MAARDAETTPTVDARDAEIARLKGQVAELQSSLAEAEVRLREMGIADPITGLYTYRYFLGRITEEVSRADRFHLIAGCLILNLDRNSVEALIEVSKMLKAACRQYDVPCRWSQQELAVLLPATDADGMQTFAERFRCAVQEAFEHHPNLAGLTISIGGACYPRPSEVEGAQQLLAAADQALHEAMDAGGNRVVLRV